MRKILFLITAVLFSLNNLSFAENTDPLLKAYKREYMFLTTQKKALQQELDKLKKQLESIKIQNQEKISQLQNKLIYLKSKIDRLEKVIEDINSQLAEKEENTQLLDATIQQAKETLHSYKIEILESKSEEKTLNNVFNKTKDLLTDLSSVRKFNGKFFLKSGQKTTGDILKVGAIARYGLSNKGEAGALIPAGDGYFTLWTDDNKFLDKTAKALIKGKNPDIIGIFLYENENKAVEPPKPVTLKETIESGGVIGYIIIGLGVLALLLVLIRIFTLLRANINTQSVTEKTVQLLSKDDLDEAINYAENKSGIIPKVITYILKNIHKDEREIEYLINEAIIHYTGRLDTFKTIILVIAAVSPLLGLLGTVSGIIETFYVITEYGTGDPKLMAGGISKALVTTELGLIVAIPAYILGSLLNGWAERIKELVEEASLKIVNAYRQCGCK